MTATPAPAPNHHHGTPPDDPRPGAPPAMFDGVADGVGDGRSAVSALTGSTIPYPYSGSRPGGPLSSAVAVSRRTTSAADIFGNLDRTSAATPDTIAAAPLVPSPTPYPDRFPVRMS